jgi:predicted PP-loop superfamily ATPase
MEIPMLLNYYAAITYALEYSIEKEAGTIRTPSTGREEYRRAFSHRVMLLKIMTIRRGMYRGRGASCGKCSSAVVKSVVVKARRLS